MKQFAEQYVLRAEVPHNEVEPVPEEEIEQEFEVTERQEQKEAGATLRSAEEFLDQPPAWYETLYQQYTSAAEAANIREEDILSKEVFTSRFFEGWTENESACLFGDDDRGYLLGLEQNGI